MTENEHRISKLKELLGLEEERRKLQSSLASIDARAAQLQAAILGAPAQAAAPAPAPSVAAAPSPAAAAPRPRPARRGRPPRAASAEAPRKALPAKPAKPVAQPKPAQPAKAARPVKLTKAGKPVAVRGQVTERILAALTAAGNKGATIKDLESATGIRYGHLSVWFATTGKKRGDVQKMKPGQYRLRAK